MELYRLFVNCIFDVLIFGHPSDFQKHCAKDLFSVAALEILVSTQKALYHVLHPGGLTLDSLDNPICGKDSGLPGPSIVSVKTATRGWTAETMKSHKFVVAPA